MRILHITTSLSGGAALAALRLHKALLDCGVDSRVLTLDADSPDESIVRFKPFIDFQNDSLATKIARGILYRMNIGMGRYWRIHDKARKGHECIYSYPVSPYRVEFHPLVKWADIIHLHWCNNFINYPSFFRNVNKPIVWTFHDIAIGYGGFHFKNDHDSLLPYYRQLEEEFLTIKRKALTACKNLTIVSLSKEMYRYTQTIDYLKNKKNYFIPNSVDTSLFRPFDKLESRKSLNLPADKTILLFVSEFVETPSKGLYFLKQTVKELDTDKMLVCIVGNYDSKTKESDTINTKYFGKVTDNELLSRLYSASNFLVVPSIQESFGQTPLESMACGTPVVVFPTGAMKDYVKPEVGVVCEDCTLEALTKGLKKALLKSYDPSTIRQYVSDDFSPQKIAQMHIDVYHSLK